MHTVYGSDGSGQTPDLITYYHQDGSKGTVGYWDTDGKLYRLDRFVGHDTDYLLTAQGAKHLMVEGNPTAQLIASQDFDESKKEEYYAYHRGVDGEVVVTQLLHARQVLLYQLLHTPNLSSGAKRPVHVLQAIGLSYQDSLGGVSLIRCDQHYHLAHCVAGKVTHSMVLSVDLTNEAILYKTLAFYQEYGINPSTQLSISGVSSQLQAQVGLYLHGIETLQVPSDHVTFSIADADHGALYPHYLAALCVS